MSLLCTGTPEHVVGLLEITQIVMAADADELRPLAVDRRQLASDAPPVPAAEGQYSAGHKNRSRPEGSIKGSRTVKAVWNGRLLQRLPFHDRLSLYRGVKKPVTVP